MKNERTLFFRYLRYRAGGIALFGVFAVIFAAVFFLCRIPPAAALYPAVLCGALGIAVIVRDYLRVRGKYRELLRFFADSDMAVGQICGPDPFPEAGSLMEARYQELLCRICRD